MMTPIEVLAVVASFMTIVSVAGNVVQYIVGRHARNLHVADTNGAFGNASRAARYINEARNRLPAPKDGDLMRLLSSAKSTIDTMKSDFQVRIKHFTGKLPEKVVSPETTEAS
ncbi:hypothetical protein ACFLSJ_01020 [Verrucomicrobiota bacterium]